MDQPKPPSSDDHATPSKPPPTAPITASGTTVLSFNQSGGVTAGTYINQAVEPQLRVTDQQSATAPDGSVTTNMKLSVVAPVTPGNLHIDVTANGLIGADLQAVPVNGVSSTMLRNTSSEVGYFSTDVPSPYGGYILEVKTASKAVINLSSHF